jgi:hypothetical protein
MRVLIAIIVCFSMFLISCNDKQKKEIKPIVKADSTVIDTAKKVETDTAKPVIADKKKETTVVKKAADKKISK